MVPTFIKLWILFPKGGVRYHPSSSKTLVDFFFLCACELKTANTIRLNTGLLISEMCCPEAQSLFSKQSLIIV